MKIIKEGYNKQGLYFVISEIEFNFSNGKKNKRLHTMFYGSKEDYNKQLEVFKKMDEDLLLKFKDMMYTTNEIK